MKYCHLKNGHSGTGGEICYQHNKLSQFNLNISIFQYFPHFNIYLPEGIREKKHISSLSLMTENKMCPTIN